MDIKEFAKSISGKERGYPQFTKEEIGIAKENGFVIVYGESDDLIEFRGAIDDEGGCFDGGEVISIKPRFAKMRATVQHLIIIVIQ